MYIMYMTVSILLWIDACTCTCVLCVLFVWVAFLSLIPTSIIIASVLCAHAYLEATSFQPIHCFPKWVKQKVSCNACTQKLSIGEVQAGKESTNREHHHGFWQWCWAELVRAHWTLKCKQVVIDFSEVRKTDQSPTVLVIDEIFMNVHLIK